MTQPNQFLALQTRLELSDAQMAVYLGVPLHTYKKWASGARKPAAAVLRLLDVLALIETLNPDLHTSMLS